MVWMFKDNDGKLFKVSSLILDIKIKLFDFEWLECLIEFEKELWL